ncbi:MAG TPA: hypothetical protein VK975_07265 [Acidimicrobiales bacterium]|nr:hypothetical protein [Acidimicrobiales bacterium]
MAEPVRAWRLPPPPPPPDVADLPPDLVRELKSLRLRLGNNLGGGTPERRRARAAYDEALVQVADLLEIPGAPEPDLVIGRRILTFPERAMLEKAVVAAGVDLGVEHRPHLRAIGPAAEPSSPPRAASAPPPPPPAPVSRRAQLTNEARAMRRRLDTYENDDRMWPTKVDEWCEDLDTFDAVLVDLALELGLPPTSLPGGDRRRLLSEEREAIERGLAEAGVDLRGVRTS